MTVDYEELANSFEAGTLEAGGFSHADHVGVAYQLLNRYDFLDASVRYANGIRTIATAAGAAEDSALPISARPAGGFSHPSSSIVRQPTRAASGRFAAARKARDKLKIETPVNSMVTIAPVDRRAGTRRQILLIRTSN